MLANGTKERELTSTLKMVEEKMAKSGPRASVRLQIVSSASFHSSSYATHTTAEPQQIKHLAYACPASYCFM